MAITPIQLQRPSPEKVHGIGSGQQECSLRDARTASRQRILFAKLGSFSGTNDRVLEQLHTHFPRHDIISFDVKDHIKRKFGTAAVNAVLEALTYGPKVLADPSERHAFFFMTPFMFRHLSEAIVRRFGPEAAGFDFVLQTQGLFKAALPGRPFIIYTDHTIASHREYPHADPRLFRSPALMRLERDLYLSADRIAVSASHVERTLVQSYGCDPARVATVLIGANVGAPEVSDALPRYAAGRIVFVGIEWERKGGPTLLAAFDQIAERFPHATLTIAGCSPRVSHPRVQALGLIPHAEVAKLLAGGSIFCLPSRVEPSAVASVEAMAFRLPVLATRVGGFPGMVNDGETGLLVPPDDPNALAEALATLLADPLKAQALGQAGYERGRTLFTWDAVGVRLAEQIAMARPKA